MSGTEYASPLREWNTLASSELAQGVPVTPALLAALIENAEHLKEVLYGRGTYSGSTKHDHLGANGNPAVRQGRGNNLLLSSAPIDGALDEDTWFYDKRMMTGTGDGFRFSGAAGATTYQLCPVYGNRSTSTYPQVSRSVVGDEANVTISCYLKLSGAATKGVFSLGMGDGSSEFSPANKCSVFYNQLSSSTWTRFYSFLSVPSAKTDTRLIVQVSEEFDAAVMATAFMACHGHRLTYWEPSRLDGNGIWGSLWWASFGVSTVPIYEKATSITNAVRLYPY